MGRTQIFFPFRLKFFKISLVVIFAKQCGKIASRDRTQVLNARVLELANKNYLGGIHVELKFIILEFLCFSVLHLLQFCVLNSNCKSKSLFKSFFESALSSLDRSTFSTLNLCFSSSNLRFSDCIFFFHWICFFSSSDRLHLHLHSSAF